MLRGQARPCLHCGTGNGSPWSCQAGLCLARQQRTQLVSFRTVEAGFGLLADQCIQPLLRGLLGKLVQGIHELRAQCFRLARKFGECELLQRGGFLPAREVFQQQRSVDAGALLQEIQQFGQQRDTGLVQLGERVGQSDLLRQRGAGQQHRDRAAYQRASGRVDGG